MKYVHQLSFGLWVATIDALLYVLASCKFICMVSADNKSVGSVLLSITNLLSPADNWKSTFFWSSHLSSLCARWADCSYCHACRIVDVLLLHGVAICTFGGKHRSTCKTGARIQIELEYFSGYFSESYFFICNFAYMQGKIQETNSWQKIWFSTCLVY